MADYSLKVKTLVRSIEQADGSTKSYELRDMSGEERDSFISFLSHKIVRGPDGKPQGFKDSAGIAIELLSKTLYDDAGSLVGKKQLAKWPATVLEGLAEEARKLCALDEESEQAEGND